MEQRFDHLTEWLDCRISRWWAFPVFMLSVALIWLVAGYDYANFYISVVTVAFFFLFNYSRRKDQLANQHKHDVEIQALDQADNDSTHVEKLTLSELEAKVQSKQR